MIQRRVAQSIQIGDVTVGGGASVVVQSMTKTDTRDVKATIDQIARLADTGCEIIRIAVPDAEAAEALVNIKRKSPIPVIADIHFDYRLAIAAMECGVDQIRFNPGNIGGKEKVEAIVRMAGDRTIPLRIGVNAGSLAHERGSIDLAEQMAQAAMGQISLLESMNFELIEVSLKASDVITTIEANRIIADKMPYPLHIGITEAGLPWAGGICSAVGLGAMLYMGIGDSIRVSLTTPDSREEIAAGYQILKSLELRQKGPRLVSCPTCGRCEAKGFYDLAKKVEKRLCQMDKVITVAVMGCVVNGPGEAKDADVGLACGKGKGIIFRKGEKVRTIDEPDFFDSLIAEVENL